MRTLIHAALQPGAGLLVFLLLFVFLFLGILAWTWLPGRRESLERESRLPLNDQEKRHAR